MEMVQFSDYRYLVFQGDCADRVGEPLFLLIFAAIIAFCRMG